METWGQTQKVRMSDEEAHRKKEAEKAKVETWGQTQKVRMSDEEAHRKKEAKKVKVEAWGQTQKVTEKEMSDEEACRKKEAKRRKRVEEELAASREQRLLDGEVAQPTTLEEFERLVVASPDSSLVWVQYMALAMQGGELEVARGVAKRALQRINFRLEGERLNIFLAWLNLENTFGTEEAMGEVLKEALQCCDQFKVYSQVAAIYQQSGKISEAEKIHKVMACRKKEAEKAKEDEERLETWSQTQKVSEKEMSDEEARHKKEAEKAKEDRRKGRKENLEKLQKKVSESNRRRRGLR